MANAKSDRREALSDRELPVSIVSNQKRGIGAGVASSLVAATEIAQNSMTAQIDALRAEQAAIVANRKRVIKELRNAERTRTILI